MIDDTHEPKLWAEISKNDRKYGNNCREIESQSAFL